MTALIHQPGVVFVKVKLDSVDPFHPELHLTLDQEVILIGRDGDAQVRLEDRWISPRHCEISQERGALVVQDLKSRHGTLVNGAVVQRSPLLPGDDLTIGIRTFRVWYQRPAIQGIP